MSKFGYVKMNRLENFGPVYVINLPDNTKRLNNIKRDLKQYRIKNYSIVEAVDGRKNNLSDIIYGEYPKLKSQEIGCVASHIKAIKRWLDTSDTEYAIIMEDDCSLQTVQFWQWDWNYFMNNIPKDADIIQLVMIKNDNVTFSMHKKESYKNIGIKHYAWSTACYLIKRSYAKKLIKEITVDDKINFSELKLTNKAADVTLYSLGNAYCMPIFTHFLDTKNAINIGHESFHKKSKDLIESWWENSAFLYSKESFFDTKNGLSKNIITKNSLTFNIFHVDGESDTLKKRKILTNRANEQLSKNFTKLDTPTIIIQSFDDVKNFFKNNNITIDPKGYKGNGWKFGELGVWASNYTAWNNFAQTNKKMLMLMEDDIILKQDFNSKLLSYIQELPDDWDFFTVYIPSFGNVKYTTSKSSLEVGRKSICKVYQSWSCLCYIVSAKGAKKLLKQVQKPVSSPIDHWLFYNDNLNGYAIKMELGNICDIYKTKSTIQSAEKHDMTGYV